MIWNCSLQTGLYLFCEIYLECGNFVVAITVYYSSEFLVSTGDSQEVPSTRHLDAEALSSQNTVAVLSSSSLSWLGLALLVS